MKNIITLFLAAAVVATAQQKVSERTTLASPSIDTAADWIGISDMSATGAERDKKTNLAELWKQLGGTNVSSTELSYLDGVTSAIQTQLGGKEASLGNPGTNGHVLSSTIGGTRSWIAPGGTWGSITGTLSGQTDLSAALGAKLPVSSPPRAAFYDNFDDRRRYPEGALVTDGVTMPQFGSAWFWKKNDGAAPADIKMIVSNGGLTPVRNGGGYLAAHFTPEDRTNFSYGFEFTRQETRHTSGTSPSNLTVTIGSAPLVNASTHEAWGNWHVNMDQVGIASQGIFGTSWNATADETTDRFTLTTFSTAGLTIETGDMVNVGGSVVPTGLSASVNYYAIKISSTVYQVALTKAQAVAGTTVPFTTNGTAVTFARGVECVNRRYRSGYNAWIPDRLESRVVSFTASTDVVTTTVPHTFLADSAVLFEGEGLGTGLLESTTYYVRDVTASTFKVALSPGGAVVDITANGSASQYCRSLSADALAQFMPLNRRNILLFTIKGDYITASLVGVGDVVFYFRDLAQIMGTSGDVGFYWQSPPERASGATFSQIFPLHAAWGDAPQMQERHLKAYSSYLNSLAASDFAQLPARVNLVGGNSHIRSAMISAFTGVSARMVAGASSITAKGSDFATGGGNFFAEGSYHSNPTFTSAGQSLIATSPATLQGLDGSVSSAAGAATNITGAVALSGLETGEMVEYTICGELVGGASKRIQLAYGGNEGDGSVFDSGSALDAVTGPYVIKVDRKQSASQSHITYATMYVNGTIIGPQRLALNYTDSYRNMVVRTTTTNAGAVTCDQIRTTIHRTKVRN